jgi:protein phosphatase 1 regulatory subunit 11
MTAVPSLTQTVAPPAGEALVLRLRLPPDAAHVHWDEEVVDNEHLKKKKSKRCCIFRKQRPFDESSSEDEKDDDEGGWELGAEGKPVWVPAPSEHSCCSHGHHHSGGGPPPQDPTET